MDQILGWLLAAGYPKSGVDWIRKRRMPIIVLLGILSWCLLLALIWLAFSVLS